MGRLIALFFACMLILSTGIGAVAHGMEPAVCADTISGQATDYPGASSGEQSLDRTGGDSRRGADDDDSATLHQHGACHGHHSSMAAGAAEPLAWSPLDLRARPLDSQDVLADHAGPVLRPPIA